VLAAKASVFRYNYGTFPVEFANDFSNGPGCGAARFAIMLRRRPRTAPTANLPMLNPSPAAVPLLHPAGRLRALTPARGYHYLLSQPRAHAPDPQPRWPVILFLHGAAERGSEVAAVARQGLPRLLLDRDELTSAERAQGNEIAESFVIVAPQCAPYEVWNDAALLELIDQVGTECPIDSARVYLTGLSMGGFGVWSLGLRHPERFAALVPICGGGRISDVATAAKTRPAALRRLGIWAFHGALDRIVPLEESERMIAAVRAAGVPDVKFTVYPDIEHDAWSTAYAHPELYPWLLRHPR
jgi:predicted peptidase